MNTEEVTETVEITGKIKWFDPVRGYGFILVEDTEGDVLLHATTLRDANIEAVAENDSITCAVIAGPRGRQAVSVIDHKSAAPPNPLRPSDLVNDFDDAGELLPARVKWFDKAKGFGFVNLFDDPQDIFIHMETLRKSGLSDLFPGEAVAIRTFVGPRGLMVAEIRDWFFGNTSS